MVTLSHYSSYLIGGLFFSVVMWLIICILTSRCKNKVTNMTDPERPIHQSSENGPDLHHHLKGKLVTHILEEPLVASLSPCPETIKDAKIRTTMQTVLPPPPPPHHKTKDFERFLRSDLRSSKSEPLVFSIGVNSPLSNTFTFKTSGEIVFGAVKVNSGAELYKQDPIHPAAPNDTTTMPNIEDEEKQKCNSDSEISVYRNPEGDPSEEKRPVTYFEAHIDPMNDTKNVNTTGKNNPEGNEPSSEHEASSSNGSPLTSGKKCKTWSTFCDPQDKSVLNPPESCDVPNALNRTGDFSKEPGSKREGLEEISCTDLEEKRKEDGSRSLGIRSHIDAGDGAQHPEVTGGQGLLEQPGAEDGPCRHQHQGSSRKTKTSKPEDRGSLSHEKLAREKFWKYHKNCCDEFEPCQMATKVLGRLKTLEKGEQKTTGVTQEPPSDQDLLEERISFPPLLFGPSEMPTNSAISSKKTCSSLPNLGVYSINNTSAISPDSPFREPSEDISVCNTHLPVIFITSDERLSEAPPSKTTLPKPNVFNKGFIKEESRLHDRSGTRGLIVRNFTPGDSARGRIGLEQGAGPCKPDLMSHDSNGQGLLDIIAEGEHGMSQVVPSSDLKLPVINLQTEGPLRDEIHNKQSSSILHIPIIDGSSEDNTIRQKPFQHDLPVNLDDSVPAQIVEMFTDISPGLSDIYVVHEDRLPDKVDCSTTVMNEGYPNNVLQGNLSKSPMAEPSEDEMLGESKAIKPGKLRSNQKVKAKSCPVFSAMLETENQDGDPNCDSKMLKFTCGPLDTKTRHVVRSTRDNIMGQHDVSTCKTSQEVPSIPVRTIDTCSQESPLSSKAQELGTNLCSNTIPSSETQLTPSGSYVTQDGDEIAEWPNTVDMLKRSSTISLCSKYDILESSLAPQCKVDNIYPSVLDNGHNTSLSMYGMDNISDTSACCQGDHKAEDVQNKESSSLGDNNYVSEKIGTLDEISVRSSGLPSEEQMTVAQRPPQSDVLDRPTNDQIMDVMPMSDLGEVITDRKEVQDQSGDVHCHQFSLLFIEQREDPLDCPLNEGNSSCNAKIQCSQHNVPKNEGEIMKNQVGTGAGGMDQSDDPTRNNCRSADSLTNDQHKTKKDHGKDGSARDEDRTKQKHKSDPEVRENQSSQYSEPTRSKDGAEKFRENIGPQKLAENKTFKAGKSIGPCIRDIGQDLRDYVSTKLSRRPFQSVFPVSVKSPCPENGTYLSTSSSDDAEFTNPPDVPSNTVSQIDVISNNTDESLKKMSDAVEYLTYLYARRQRLKVSQDSHRFPDKDDRALDDIRVLANLQFCKVSGRFIIDAKTPDTVEEEAKDPKSPPIILDNPYVPPSKEELKADEELAVLNIMCTLKKSLELSASYDSDEIDT